ncbi:MAG TPA: hypothetical protein VMZ91_00290, partial [Candidatus Paceibacterota bacterium]|nr:hypothetical protein [Candidatus Paceibacterota bacterium]
MDRKILSKLIDLKSKKANEYLSKYANKIQREILRSKDNDEIFKNLQLLGEFVYKVPTQALDIIRMVIKDKKSNKVKIYKGRFLEKDYKDLILECIDLLNKIRFIKPSEVLTLLSFLHTYEDNRVRGEVDKTLERLIKYDLQVLNKVWYAVQRKILDTVLNWEKTKKIKNIEIIKIIAKELLDSSFEGVGMKDFKTMVFKSGTLKPDDSLKKIRKETMGLLVLLFNEVKDIKTKISLLQVLNYASQSPHTLYGDDVIAMLIENIKYLVNIYDKIIFNSKDKIITELPIVQEIEHQLIWFNKNYKDKIPEITLLLNKIKKDSFYSFYRILVGDYWDTYEEEKEEGGKDRLKLILKEIKKGNVKKWIGKLNLIASYKNIVDEWKFQLFSDLLIRLAKEKPNLSGIILSDALVYGKSLKRFIWQFLFGFRQGNHLKLWDEFVEKIIINRDIELLISIASSINLESARKKDIELLSRIIKRDKPFKFLNKSDKKLLVQLNSILMRALTNLYDKGKKKIEELIVYMIKQEENEQNLWLYVEILGFPTRNEKINFSDWSEENIKIILDMLVAVKNLDYNAQILLLSIAKKHFTSAMEVFVKRIKKRDEITTEKWISSTIYNVIPYHFENAFRVYLRENKQYPKIVRRWIEDMTPKSSMYNLELAQLLRKIGGESSREILLQLIKKGKYENLKKAVDLLWGLEPS